MPLEKKKLILVVDDETDMLTFVGTVLETSGFRVLTAGDGETALGLAQVDPPDMVILDIMMPRVEDGLETYVKLRTRPGLSGISIVMLSAIAKTTFFHMIKNLAASPEINVKEPDAYLEKPPEASDIMDVVHKIIGGLEQSGRAPKSIG
jgi:CheY-like chemotaxis protein